MSIIDPPPNEPQSIEELKARYEKLSTQRRQAETDLRVAEERLKLAKSSAMEQYGTDDLEELKAKLAQWTEENVQRRREYQESLDGIENELAKIKNESTGAE